MTTRSVATADRMASSGDRVLIVAYHRDGARAATARIGEPIVVGRDPDVGLFLDEPALSREHASFEWTGKDMIVRDLGSRNGSWLGQEPLQEARVPLGTAVRLGHLTVVIQPSRGEEAPSGAVGFDLLRSHLASELVRSRHFGRAVAIVTLRAAQRVGGHVAGWMNELQPLLRPVDEVALFAADTVDVLLPEMPLERAVDLAHQILRAASTPLRAGVAAFPGSANEANRLLELSHRAVRQATDKDPVGVAEQGTHVWQPAPKSENDTGPVVRAPAMKELYRRAERYSRSVISVLLIGETGTGKEVLAQALHESGPRRPKPMISVNCAAISPQLLESTLFGHERGAFTGADRQRDGVFQSAHGGTVFLDEVGELPLDAQAKLLRVLESKRVTRVGSMKEVEVDVRVVSATNRNLEAMRDRGAFREDLLFRLNAAVLHIPPLRERREEILPLARRFLRAALATTESEVRGFDPFAEELLCKHAWPGNARELKNAVDQAVALATGTVILPEDLPTGIRALARPTEARPSLPIAAPTPAPDFDPAAPAESYTAKMARLEAAMLTEELRRAGWNQSETARRLQMPLRTLQHKIKVLKIARKGT